MYVITNKTIYRDIVIFGDVYPFLWKLIIEII